MRRSANVAVVGAGAAGLAAVRELVREGHSVTCYEVIPQKSCGLTLVCRMMQQSRCDLSCSTFVGSW